MGLLVTNTRQAVPVSRFSIETFVIVACGSAAFSRPEQDEIFPADWAEPKHVTARITADTNVRFDEMMVMFSPAGDLLHRDLEQVI